MQKIWLFKATLCFFVVFMLGIATQAGDVITFQIHVLPGMTLSSPDSLVFDPAAPGQTIRKDLNITVWSNVRWELTAQAISPENEGALGGRVEVEDVQGDWLSIFARQRKIRSYQLPTGSMGSLVNVPFRFIGSYQDSPGDYFFEVEFTVGPSI